MFRGVGLGFRMWGGHWICIWSIMEHQVENELKKDMRHQIETGFV